MEFEDTNPTFFTQSQPGSHTAGWGNIYQVIRSAIQSGDMKQANQLLRMVFNEHSNDPEFWLLLAWTAPNLRSAENIIKVFRRQHPDYPVSRQSVPWSGKEWSERMPGRGTASPVAVEENVNTRPGDSRMDVVWVMRFRLAGALIKTKFSIYLAFYMVVITTAEATTTFLSPRLGLVIHGILLVLILLHTGLGASTSQRKFLLALALAPLIRLMSLSMPLLQFDTMLWYMIIGLPLLISAMVVYRLSGYKPGQVGLGLGKNLPLQLAVAVAGVGLGYLEYLILRPEPLAESFSLESLWLPALILLVFTGFLEEWIFRGLMQRAAVSVLQKIGPWYISLMFAVLHIGYRSWVDLIFVFLVGFGFSLVAQRTHSLLGVTLAHGLTNISLFLVFPFILAAPLTAETPTLPVPAQISGPAMWSSQPKLTPRPTRMPVTTPTSTPTSTATITPAGPESTVLSDTATAIPTATRTATAISNQTATPTATKTITPTITPTPTRTPSPTTTATATLTPTGTVTPTATSTPVPTASETALPTATETPIPTDILPPEPTATITPRPTDILPPEPALIP
jgi:membrane protease YdiL (CAAX protease family)